MAFRVLVPLDGSTFGEQALAAALALRGDREVVIDALILVERPFFATREYIRSAEEWSERYIPTLQDRYAPSGVELRPRLRVTHPEEALAEAAGAAAADLVVVSSHGRGPMARFIMGSWSDTLIRTARPPVLVVPSDEEDVEEADLREAKPIRHVLVALDDSEVSRTVLGPLPTILGEGGRVTLTTVVPTATEMASVYGRGYALPRAAGPGDEDAMSVAERALLEVRRDLAGGGFEVDTEVVDGLEPASAILRTAERLGVDAIALSTRGREGVSRALLGSVADRVIRHARRPVLVLNPAAEAPDA